MIWIGQMEMAISFNLVYGRFFVFTLVRYTDITTKCAFGNIGSCLFDTLKLPTPQIFLR